jgi:alkanesulfonate monooxygenase SsuD/methylene tetrahydromethanopterin reductase-like flavin-dependent oxidoreductase (luciferase family)
MFRAWVFTEMAYPYLPPEEMFESARVSLPNSNYDPETGYQLYKAAFDIYRAADELGLDVQLNEHHATATCVNAAVPVTMAILARETKHARIMALGNPIANRKSPVRVAEEMAMIDVICQGRSEVGFVRGVPQEISAGNVNPVDTKGRFWEAAKLIVKAWTTHDGPFNWEGRYYHHRQVNIWPRPYQRPHPPIWVPTQSATSATEVADRQYKLATVLTGMAGTKKIFDAYRDRTAELGLPEPPPERFGYSCLVFVGETDEEGYEGARKLQWYVQHNKVAPQFVNVPGYFDAAARGAMLRKQARGDSLSSPIAHLAHSPIQELTDGGYFFAGSPDTVFKQLKRFHHSVGGLGNLLMMVQSGTMGFDLVEKSMRLFAQEVLPRFRAEVFDSESDAAMPAVA